MNGSHGEPCCYDLLDLSTSSTGPWGEVSYSYDEAGNRLLMEVDQSQISYSFDCMDRLTQVGRDALLLGR